ncbi:U3 small nucleolar RNA-associated protein 25 homolog [Neodiprion fabricii]|uniref:U3 small nucleolar RNA-associated protein 25 homolog n=1 Tax=Neodiprion fabricii TaxID=2872261 RepID=UPI001ED97870|nr:U3 small nucleolar RNA-associated protein 25 homolog [Neodiprion fabricii]
MVRGKKPTRGGNRRKFDKRFEHKPKVKKCKFNIREASYVKERDAKNEEIENRRRKLEAERSKQLELEAESSEEEREDPLKMLLSAIGGAETKRQPVIDSDCESESESEPDDEAEVKSSVAEENLFKTINSGVDHVTSEASDAEHVEINLREEEEEDQETAREDAGKLRDPFSIHLLNDLDDDLYKSVSLTPQKAATSRSKWPALGTVVFQIPEVEDEFSKPVRKRPKVSILEDKQFARHGAVPQVIDDVDWDKLFIKSQIQGNISKANYDNIKDSLASKPSPLTPLQKELFTIINNYQDLCYNERNFANGEQIRFLYCLHAVNHVLKTRTKVLHHNAKLTKAKKSGIADIPDEYRDQGLVRPKVLIIVPFRHTCLKIVRLLIAILIGEDKGGSVVNKLRFMEDFSGNELAMPRKNPKPEDYEQTFEGNVDDTFKIGISVTKKTLKLYSDFYSSDIIISSVLGLRMLVGAEGEPDRDYDFLASVELLVMDQTEVFAMQNWDHLLHVLDHAHLQPKESHGTDFSRVRSWVVNGWSKFYRQTLIFSGVPLPEIHAIFNKRCFNYAGKARVVNPVTSGTVCQTVIQVPQVFHRFDSRDHGHDIEARFTFFVSKILPQYKDSIMNHTVIYVPSYFDFVKVRNYFKKEELSFVQICEYSKDAKVARARDMFYHSDAHFLIYSERFHFFRRIRLKGIRHLIFFAPPTFPHFYSEICNLMQKANQNPNAGSDSNMTVTLVYSKYDALKLAGIVGTERTTKMISSGQDVHMFMTGD